MYLGLLLSFALAVLVGTSIARAGMSSSRTEAAPKPEIEERTPEPTYTVQAGLEGDVFPAFANYASLQKPEERTWPTVTVKLTNSSDKLVRRRIAVHIAGWSDEEVQMAEVAAGKLAEFKFAPSFLARFYRNRQLVAATAVVHISDMAGSTVFSSTTPVRLRSADDMYWGKGFQHADFIASWVTPHDPRVEAILARAKEFMPERRLPGYERNRTPEMQERSTVLQARAIYRALQRTGVSYVKSSGTFGARSTAHYAERVRMPSESLRDVSANCIDGAVLFASLFENLGMDPVIVLVPGHAYVGVRVAANSDRFLYIETALTGRAGFQMAVNAGRRGVQRFKASETIRIPIDEARRAGIFPLPNAQRSPEEQAENR
ncbi:MAG: hypothetical protein ACE14L_15305 [Terriglobales bacterium]